MGTALEASSPALEAGARPDVSVVIVHYETPELLGRCLEAVGSSVGDLTREVIVVDNASAGFDAAGFERRFPNVKFVRNSANAGFAVASNVGLRRSSGRYLLLLNPDAIVAPDTLAAMVEFMDQRPDVGCATARLVLLDGRLDAACRRSFPTLGNAFYRLILLSKLFPRSRRFGSYNLSYLDPAVETEIDSPCGAFMLVRREVADEVGLLDESYFMYGEDLDWAYRIKQAGWKVMYTPITTVVHQKRAASRLSRARSIRHFYEAMRIFYRRHYQDRYPRAVSRLVYAAIRGRELVELAFDRTRRRRLNEEPGH